MEKTTKKTKKKKEKQSLVIVESPAKAKTIEKYLGSDYVVKASMGHLIDLPKSTLGVQIENNFEPQYITVRGSGPILKELQKYAKKSKQVFLASDNDREGEAIAYHLQKSISAKYDVPICRIVFNEITPNAIKEAVKNPMEINECKVDAQKARRVLDRVIGYKLTPVLWEKVKNRLSAGRVQSVALRLICERENEVENFIPDEYWTLDGDFKKGKTEFVAQLLKYMNKKPELQNSEEVEKIIKVLKSSKAVIDDIKVTNKTLKPKAPFTTSTLQQVSATRLGFTSRKTMQVAQQLYEGVQVDSGRVGLITYMRTDSVRISDVALDAVRGWIKDNHPKCLPDRPNIYAVGKKAQDAHEGIRPTYVEYTPAYLQSYLSKDQFRLYSLIWERFVSSQMTNAKSETTSYDLNVGDAIFRVSSTKITDKGFQSVLKTLILKEDKLKSIPKMKIGDEVQILKFRPEQHFTQGPARFTDASIVKILEEKGIGRPSTYAPIISVLLDRYYVTRKNKQLVPTQLGKIINKILVENFSSVIDVEFTASMEALLDQVAEENTEWQKVLSEFYPSFQEQIDSVMENLESIKGSFDEKTELICEKCGKHMLKKLGRYGFFLACEGFPECRNTKSIPLAKCPIDGCDGDIIARKAKGRGREFYGCTNYPKCDFISHFKPIDSNCPKCGWFLVEKYDKTHGSYKSCINPKCDYLHSVVEGVEDVKIDQEEVE